MTTTATQEKFEHWMIVELMGHNIIAGFVSEQTIGGAALIRVDVPKTDKAEPFTKFFNSSAVYAMTPTTEEIATVAANKLATRPISPYILPDPEPRRMIDSRADESYGEDVEF